MEERVLLRRGGCREKEKEKGVVKQEILELKKNKTKFGEICNCTYLLTGVVRTKFVEK